MWPLTIQSLALQCIMWPHTVQSLTLQCSMYCHCHMVYSGRSDGTVHGHMVYCSVSDWTVYGHMAILWWQSSCTSFTIVSASLLFSFTYRLQKCMNLLINAIPHSSHTCYTTIHTSHKIGCFKCPTFPYKFNNIKSLHIIVLLLQIWLILHINLLSSFSWLVFVESNLWPPAIISILKTSELTITNTITSYNWCINLLA